MSLPTRGDNIEIVFDRQPPSTNKLGLNLSTGVPYPATRVNHDLGLYLLHDNDKKPFNVSTFGAGYHNNGWWHIVGEKPSFWADDDE